MPLLDLATRHVLKEVLLHDIFLSVVDASFFLNDAALNDLKSIKQISSHWNKIWKWEVQITRGP